MGGQGLRRRCVRLVRYVYLRLLDFKDRMAGGADKLVPPRSLHFVGGGDFREVGRTYLGHFRAIANLGTGESVLDIGCGTGRMAVPLIDFLDAGGSYTGFDISAPAVEWCGSNITAVNPRFRFVHADVYNLEYNPKGGARADAYRFPCEDRSVDFAFATSVFTHMHADEIRNYLAELHRVLRPGGRALLTFFICEGTTGRPAAAMDFCHVQGEGLTIDPQTPERAMAFSEGWVRKAFDGAGLAIREPILYGNWSGRTDGADFQDMVLAVRSPQST